MSKDSTITSNRGGGFLALRPARSPIHEHFAPYYERALSGDLDALVEYYKENWPESDLGSAFYECIGYLVTICAFKKPRRIVRRMMNLEDPLFAKPSKIASYKYWTERLLPEAKRAKAWIRKKQSGSESFFSRKRLWNHYLFEEIPELDLEQRKHRKEELEHLVGESESKSSLPSSTSAARLLSFGKIPKEMFFDLAQTRPNIPPSEAVRRFAAKLAGVSVSLVSRKARAK